MDGDRGKSLIATKGVSVVHEGDSHQELSLRSRYDPIVRGCPHFDAIVRGGLIVVILRERA